MTRITPEAAAKQLPALLAAVMAGEEVELVQEGRSVARLVAIADSGMQQASGPIECDPCVGLWADREEMQDSAAWVNSIREHEWKRL